MLPPLFCIPVLHKHFAQKRVAISRKHTFFPRNYGDRLVPHEGSSVIHLSINPLCASAEEPQPYSYNNIKIAKINSCVIPAFIIHYT